MNGALTWALALTLSSSPPPTDASASASVPDDRLVIEVDSGVPRADSLRERLKVAGGASLATHGTKLSPEDQVLVHISGDQYAYAVRITLSSRGAVVYDNAVDCECSTTELNETVKAEIERATEQLAKAVDAPVADEQVGAAAEQEQEHPPTPDGASLQRVPPPPRPSVSPTTLGPIEPADPPKPAPRDRGARRTKIAGVATLIAGGALLFVGAAMMAEGTTALVDRVPHYERDWRPLGYGLGGAGITGIAVGGTLLIIDEIRCRRQPAACAANGRYARRRPAHRIDAGGSL